MSRNIQCYLGISLFAALLLISTLWRQIESVDASGKSPYDSGYDHGCDDADISNPDDRYINQPEKGPSFHTDEFMDGYNSGFNACSGGSTGDDDDNSGRTNDGEIPRSGGVNWVQLCSDLQPILISDCSQLVNSNNILTLEGERAVGCIRNGLLLGGGGALLLKLPLPSVISILQTLSEPTGCGDIIEWGFIGSVSNLKGMISKLTR